MREGEIVEEKRIVRIVFTLAGAAIGASYFPLIWLLFQVRYGTLFNNTATNAVVGAIIFIYFVADRELYLKSR